MKHYLQVTDEHWRRAVMEETTHTQSGTECAPLQNKITLIDELLSVLQTLSPESQRELLRASLEQKQGESNNE